MSTRLEVLKSKLKPITPSETLHSMYPVEEFCTDNKLFLVASAEIKKGGVDDDISELEERDSSGTVVRRYLYWSIFDLNMSSSSGYELI
ncbi:hypothetical protein ABTI51_12985 [Acinetobacter baumannii]|uniref:hypothetical protein n=1 Tax=Acinetobacter baumannii TaxID=470 RepID=UPI000667F67F|nr:hypothetical protein [Acinetobacter baumannii]MDC5425588.1 hypothetical protein [Acinetobacter baumannii]